MDIKKTPLALVYYRDMPILLETLVTSEKGISYTKDGVSRDLGHSCPRMTILTELDKEGNPDQKSIQKVKSVLEELQKNNQISGYKIVLKKSTK